MKYLTWKNYWSFKKIYKISIKQKILGGCTIPVLTYAVQAWAATEGRMDKIAKTQIAMGRSIIGVKKDRVKNQNVRKRMEVKDYRYMAKKLKMDYAERAARGGKNR